MIKYLGSKKKFVGVLGEMFTQSGAKTALDLFTGTTRVAQEFKQRGGEVTAVDLARYSEVFAKCWIETDADDIDAHELAEALQYLNGVRGHAGYFTETFCEESRFFQPKNGEKVDAIRELIDKEFKDSPLFPILLTSLIDAADKVDSTTGVQMAYLKKWADRSYNDLVLRDPGLIRGTGKSIRGDALALAPTLGSFDIAYLDPPYNQHRYYSNYHIWETLVAWDAPEAYGIARKRIDVRDDSTKSRFNEKRNMPEAFANVVKSLDVESLILSYNNESWVSKDQLMEMCSGFESVKILSFDYKRYVGAQIGIFNPAGEKVGNVSHLRNLEWMAVAGPRSKVEKMTSNVAGVSDALF